MSIAVSEKPLGGISVQPLVLTELDHQPAANAARAAAQLATTTSAPGNPLHSVRTRLTVCVGAVELSVGELLGAKEQQVLRLDRTVEQAVDILLEGQVVARGILVAVEDHFGVRITELPRPLTP